MTELDVLIEINGKLGTILGYWERLEEWYTGLVSWLSTPAGDLAIMPGATFGTLLVALVLTLYVAMWVVRQVASAYGGRW